VRAVLDTNVVVSGIFFGGVPRAILDLVADGAFELILTPGIWRSIIAPTTRLSSGHPELEPPTPLLRLACMRHPPGCARSGQVQAEQLAADIVQ
jgi:hypothetical protein